MQRKQPQTLWQIAGYSTLLLLGIVGLYNESLLDIMTHIQDIWQYPLIYRRVTRLYFELEITWYVHSLCCTLINRQAKDFCVMLFHHTITPFECYYAYTCGYGAIGLYIMFLHDAGDVPLHVAKAFHNLNWTRLTDATFFAFTLVFCVTRLILLPMCPWAYFFKNTPKHQSLCGDALAYTCVILCFLHLYWFYLILVLIRRFASKGNIEGDIREKDIEDKMMTDDAQRDKLKQQTKVNTIKTTKHESVAIEGEEFTPEVDQTQDESNSVAQRRPKAKSQKSNGKGSAKATNGH